MFKLWAKAYNENNKIIRNQTFEFKQEFDAKFLNAYLQVVCNAWHTETPIVLSYHVIGFNEFNSVKFKKADFVDEVDFESMSIQLIP